MIEIMSLHPQLDFFVVLYYMYIYIIFASHTACEPTGMKLILSFISYNFKQTVCSRHMMTEKHSVNLGAEKTTKGLK